MATRYLRSTDGSDSDSGATWALAKATLVGIDGIDTAGDTIFISQSHSENTALGANATVNLAGTEASPTKLICGNDAAEPPTSVAISGVIGISTGSYSYTVNGTFYAYGLTFHAGIGGGIINSKFIFGANGNSWQQFESCNFINDATGANAGFTFGGSGNNPPVDVDWKNCWLKLAKNTQNISVISTRFFWQGGGLLSGNAIDTTLVSVNSAGEGFLIELSGLDLSNMGTATDIFSIVGSTGRATIRDCKLPTGWTGLLTSSVTQSSRCSMYNCDAAAADTNYRMWVVDYTGQMRSETTIVRSGGASDGTTSLSWKVITGSNAIEYIAPFNTDEIIRWNDTVGISITATIEIVHDSQGAGTGGALQNDEIWLEVLYAGTSGESLGVFTSNHKADYLASAADHTTSSETWTTTGLTSPVKQKLSVTFTPQEKGYLKARVYLGKASKTVYVCPKMDIT